jgi:hypothetical protein
MNSKGKLYSYFCSISLQITEKTLLITDDKCLLKLWNVPFNDAIQKYVLSCNGTFSDIRYERNIFIEFEASNTKILRELAMLIEDITKPGARYNVPSYKYVCPRTAYSLIRLADYLDDFYKDN